jgi:hypothetical protein
MTRIRSTLRFAAPLALLLGAAMPSPGAVAGDNDGGDWWLLSESKDSDGTTRQIFKEQYGNRLMVWFWHSDGSASCIVLGDPGPDDPTQRIDKPDVAGLIKKGLITYEVRSTPESTPLAQWIDREGGGVIPHYNPGDQDTTTGRGQPPKGPDTGMTAKEKADLARLVNFTAKSLASIGQSMGGEETSGETPITPSSHGTGRKGTGTGKGSKNTGQYVPRDVDTLGPRPDLVNPPHKTKSGNTGTNAIAPGLLEGDSALGTQGPAGTGSGARGVTGSPLR